MLMTSEQLFSADQVAEILGVSPSTLARWRQTGEPDLPYLRLGGRIRYRASDLEEFLDEIEGDEDVDADEADVEDEEDED
jgi:excisionase family DNA binding protein